MKKFLQILITAMVGAFLAAGVAGATSNTSDCDIYQKNSTSYNNCLNNLTKTSVQVVCDNNVYVINNNSQNAGTGGSVTINGTSVSGSATNTSGATVTIGASCGQVASSGSTTPPSTSGPGSSSTAAKKPSSSTAVAAASLPETGSNTVVNAAIVGTALLVGGLVISYVGTALYRRAALKD